MTDEVGWHLALTREEARQLFGAREDGAVWQLVVELAGELAGGPRRHDSTVWRSLQAALSGLADEGDGSGGAGAGCELLGQLVLGSRSLHRGPERTVTMVRPDLVPHLAEQASRVDRLALDRLARERLAAAPNSDELWYHFTEIRELFVQAGRQQHCVVFAVKMKGEEP